MTVNVTQIAMTIKDFQSGLLVLKQQQSDLLSRVKKTIYDRKMAEINTVLSK